MKKIILAIVLLSALHSPLSTLRAQQTYSQPLPKQVTEIHYSPSTHIETEHGTTPALIVGRDTLVATVRRNVLTINPTVDKVTIVLNPEAQPVSIICDVLRHDSRGSLIAHQGDTAASAGEKRSFWRWRDVELDFAWGFHNWGTDRLGGFEGVDGDAALRTSFNNLQLTVNYPLVGTRHTGLYLGFGLEWDKYKFGGSEITLGTATTPHTFADGGDPGCSSWLNTRYVVVPLTLRIDLWHDWTLRLAAIPGLHWGGSHTGLRREYDTDLEDRTEYDQSVNRYINPYKLDLRATLSYDGIGLYLQVPTMSTFRSSVQDLYPIRFGLYLAID